MEPTRVAIINAGEWGGMRQEDGDYDAFVKRVKRATGNAKSVIDDGPAAEVKVFTAVDEAESWLQRNGIAIFVTRGMAEKAKRLAGRCRNVRVLLFTGAIPAGEVVFVNKLWFTNEFIERVVIDP